MTIAGPPNGCTATTASGAGIAGLTGPCNSRFPFGPFKLNSSVNLENQDRGIGRSVLRDGNEVAANFRYQAPCSSERSGGNLGQQFVVVRVGLLVNVHATIGRGVNALARGVVNHVIDTLGNREGCKFLSCLRVHHDHRTAAASHKQAVTILIEGHRNDWLALGDRPTGNHLTLLAVNDIHLILVLVVHVNLRTRLLERHGLECVAVNFDVSDFLAGSSVNHGNHRELLMNVSAAVVDVEVFCPGIESNRISILQQLYARERRVGGSVKDFEVSGAVGHVDAVDVFAIQNSVSFADTSNGVDGFTGLEVENENSFVVFGGGEQSVTFEVHLEVVEMPLHGGGQFDGLDELERGLLALSLYDCKDESCNQDTQPRLHTSLLRCCRLIFYLPVAFASASQHNSIWAERTENKINFYLAVLAKPIGVA